MTTYDQSVSCKYSDTFKYLLSYHSNVPSTQKDQEKIMWLYRNAVQSHDAAQQELQDRTTPIKVVMTHAFPKDNLELMQAQIASGDLSNPHQSYKSCASRIQSR